MASYAENISIGWRHHDKFHISLDPNEPTEPTIVVPSTWMDEFLGSNVSLTCLITAYPPPEMSWFKDGESLLDTARYRQEVTTFNSRNWLMILHITELMMGDTGQYICRAVNESPNGETEEGLGQIGLHGKWIRFLESLPPGVHFDNKD